MTITITQSILTLIAIGLPDVIVAQDIDARIINGEDAPSGRYPWIVRYSFNSETSACGGSLIAPDLVLTNAHCVAESNPDLGNAYIGKYDASNTAEGGPIRPVIARYPHPAYSVNPDGTFNPSHDVALLKLDRAPTEFQLIELNVDPNYPATTGEELLMLGWGSTTNGVDAPLESSDILQQAFTSYISFEECAVASDPTMDIAFGTSVTDTRVGPDWLCTDDPISHHCIGDSGGPIIRLGSTAAEDLLVGVISGDSGGCDNALLPQINQRVSYHFDWIRETGCEISDAPLEQWNCGGNDSSTSLPTQSPTTMPPNVVPTSVPTTATESAPTAVPSTTTVLQPDDEREDITPSPISATIGAPTPQPTVDPTSEPTPSVTSGIPSLVPTRAPVSVAAPGTTEVTVYIKIIFEDAPPQQIGWYIADANYSRFRVAVPFGAYMASDEVINDQVSVIGGESYQFVISNVAGKGLSEGGSYEVYLGEEFDYEVLASGAGDFGTNETTIFFVPTSPSADLPTRALVPSSAPSIAERNPSASSREPTGSSRLTRAPTTSPRTENSMASSAANQQTHGAFALGMTIVLLVAALFI